MKVVLVGGGSGGHLTPLLAVADALKSKDSSTYIVYVGQKEEGLSDVLQSPLIDKSLAISAGKFRRYHGTSFWAHLLDFHTIFLNIRDFFRFLRGSVEACRILKTEKPDVIFLKGGFVCVPVGFAARMRKIPYITHDSDAIPGLANRLTAKHATYNTTAQEPNLYPYPLEKTIQVGIPLQKEYQFVDTHAQQLAKQKLGYGAQDFVVLSVGGGLGARRINEALVGSAREILQQKNAVIIHLTGKKLYKETMQQYEQTISEEDRARIRCIDFSTELYTLSAAADIVILRAGATNLAEMAVQGKACVVVPNPLLTGGQQLHNAKIIATHKAAVVLSEEVLHKQLGATIVELMHNDMQRSTYAANICKLADTESADKIAALLLRLGSKTT